MKFLAVLVFCVGMVAVLADTETVEEIKQKFKTAHKTCQTDKETAVDTDEFQTYKASKGHGTKPTNMGRHTLCMSKALGWQNTDGTMNKTYLKEKITETVHDTHEADKILTECTKVQEDEVAIAENLFKCFFDWHDTKTEHHA